MEEALQHSRQFRGLARISLDHLVFDDVLAKAKHRPVSSHNVTRLRQIFELEGCKKYDESNYISAIVPNDLVSDIELPLYSSDISLIPTLGHPVKCLNGLHRIRAAQEYLDPNDRWWIVRLYVEGQSALETTLIEETRNERPIPDGEIFRRIRLYHRGKCTELEQKWWARLSESKRKDLRQLLKNQKYAEAFDQLLEWPGLWYPIQLGTLHRLLTMRCDEELLRYLDHVRKTWTKVLAGTSVQFNDIVVDENSVHFLQALAPQRSLRDRNNIEVGMRDNSLFPSVSDQLSRDIIFRNICDIDGLVPSLFTFFESLKYLEPCCKILRDLVPLKSKRTIRQELFAHYWPQPSYPIEYGDSDRRLLPSDSSEHACELGYWQLWLYTLRNFPDLSPFSPRKELKKGKPQAKEPNPALLRQLGDLAFRLGFQTPAAKASKERDAEADIAVRFISQCGGIISQCEREIAALISIGKAVSQQASMAAYLDSPPLSGTTILPKDRRVGRPYEDSFQHDRQYLFLPYLCSSPTSASDITSLFATRDMFVSFFGLDAEKLPDFRVLFYENRREQPSTVTQAQTICGGNCDQSEALRSQLNDMKEQTSNLPEQQYPDANAHDQHAEVHDTEIDILRAELNTAKVELLALAERARSEAEAYVAKIEKVQSEHSQCQSAARMMTNRLDSTEMELDNMRKLYRDVQNGRDEEAARASKFHEELENARGNVETDKHTLEINVRELNEQLTSALGSNAEETSRANRLHDDLRAAISSKEDFISIRDGELAHFTRLLEEEREKTSHLEAKLKSDTAEWQHLKSLHDENRKGLEQPITLLRSLQHADADTDLCDQYQMLINTILSVKQDSPQQTLRHIHAFYSAVQSSQGTGHVSSAEQGFNDKLSGYQFRHSGELLLVLVVLTPDHKLRVQDLSVHDMDIKRFALELSSINMVILSPAKKRLPSVEVEYIESCLKKEGGLYFGEEKAIDRFYKGQVVVDADPEGSISDMMPSKKRPRSY